MLRDLKISRLAMVCALCAMSVPAAHAAASVRTLGGAGTYSSASSAASAKSDGAATAARAGSVRVTPTAGRTTTATSGATASAGATANRGATTQRLSIGKYLGGATSVSGGSSVRPGGSTGGGTIDPGVTNELRQEMDQLRREVDALGDNKQDSLQFGDYLGFDRNEVYVDIDAIKGDLGDIGAAGREVVIDADENGIKWQYDGDGAKWSYLTTWDKITGPQGLPGEKGDKGDTGDVGDIDLSNYATLEKLGQEITAAVNGLVTTGQLTAATADLATKAELNAKADKTALDGLVTTEQLATKADKTELIGLVTQSQLDAKADQTALDLKANVADVYTKNEVYNKGEIDATVQGIVAGGMDGVEEVLKGKADKDYVDTGLAAKADKSEIPTVPTNVSAFTNDAGYLTEHQSLAGLATTEQLNAKADKSEIPTVPTNVSAFTNDAGYLTEHQSLAGLATTAQLAAKADAANVYTKNEVYNKGEVDSKVQGIVAGGMEGVEEVLAGKADKTYVDTELGKKANAADLGDLAAKDQVSNDDIVDATITKSKLAAGVQTSLDRADAAVTTEGVPETGDFVLAVSNGQKTWFEVVEKITE